MTEPVVPRGRATVANRRVRLTVATRRVRVTVETDPRPEAQGEAA